MKKFFLLGLLFTAASLAFGTKEAILPIGLNYDLTEMGYMDSPIQTKAGIVLTNNRQSEIYLLENGSLVTLVASPGCGRYMQLSADGTKIGFKSINKEGLQAPAILNLLDRKVTLLANYSNQCGQVSFDNNGTIVYTIGNNLVVIGNGREKTIPLQFYTNIARISADGQYVALSNADGQPAVYNLSNGQLNVLSQTTDLWNPCWSADGLKVVYERGNLSLYAYDLKSGTEYALGRGFGAKWLNNDELVFSRPEYVDDDIFYYLGTSICRSRFDGSHFAQILPISEECPQEVGLLSKNQMMVAYANGDRRLVSFDIQSPTHQTTLCSIPMDQQFGIVHPEPQFAGQVATDAPNSIGGPLEYYDIPYINQCYDTPDYNGQHLYGPCACAPSTSCMVLAYYGYLDSVAVTSRSGNWGRTNYFSWYVGQVYTHPLTGTTFNLERESSCGGPAAGGYGFQWTNGSPSTRMVLYYTNNGINNSSFDYNGLVTIRNEARYGYPFSWCITSSKSNGHVILPYRADAVYEQTSSSAHTYKPMNGSVVVQDPYGNANNSTWKGDGRHANYDCSGFNNGHIVMYNAWGVKIHLSNTPDSIQYELNGGHWAGEPAPTVFYSDVVLPTPVKDGATFNGWFTDNTYSTRVTSIYPHCGIETLYALWSDMPLMHYVLNGGNLPEGVQLPSVVTEDYTLPQPYRNNYDFTGWVWATDLFTTVTVLHPGEGGYLYATWQKSTALEQIDQTILYKNGIILNPEHRFIQIYSPDGRLIMSGTDELSLLQQPAGIYIIRTENSTVKVLR